MLSEVRALLDVQELDKEVLELNAQLARYPVIWEEVKRKLAVSKAALAAANDARENQQKERKRLEQKLRLYSDELRRNQAQQAIIKTSKEYEAVNKQIEAVKAKISQLEEQGLALITDEPKVAEALVTATAEVARVEEQYRTEKERIRVQFNDKKSRVAEMEKSRKQLAAKLDPANFTNYERIFKRHPGSVVVPVRSGSCSGCHFGLLANVLVQVHRSDKPTLCPNCGRIISEDEDFQADQERAG